jgi:polyisoprenoid-binding protein YceI
MKKVFLMFSVAALFAACSNSGNQATDAATVSADSTGVNYTVDATASTINWEAFKIVGGHQGTIGLTEGNFNIKDGNILSGGFTINMSTIANTDIPVGPDSMNFKLVGHLTSPDFFDVAKYPTGKFEITTVTPLTADAAGNTHTISGNLTIKDSVKNITFPAKVTINGDEVTAEGTATVNRLQFGIVYNSVSVSPAALLKKLGDNAIKDELNIKIALKAKKG